MYIIPSRVYMLSQEKNCKSGPLFCYHLLETPFLCQPPLLWTGVAQDDRKHLTSRTPSLVSNLLELHLFQEIGQVPFKMASRMTACLWV